MYKNSTLESCNGSSFRRKHIFSKGYNFENAFKVNKYVNFFIKADPNYKNYKLLVFQYFSHAIGFPAIVFGLWLRAS